MKKLSIAAVLAVITLVIGFTVAIAATPAPRTTPSKAVETELMDAENMAEHFAKAREAYLKKEYKESAVEIRKVEAYLRTEATHADATSRKELTSAAVELQEIAKKAEKGTIKTDKEFDQDFARAHYAMSRYHRTKASTYMTKKEPANAGRELKLSAAHLEKALKVMGRETETDVVNGANIVADKLVAGAKWTDKEVKDAFNNMDNKLDQIGKDLLK